MTQNETNLQDSFTEANNKIIDELIRLNPILQKFDFFPLKFKDRQFIGHISLPYIWEDNQVSFTTWTLVKFLKRIFPFYGHFRKRFQKDFDLFPFYPGSFERHCKWGWIYWQEYKSNKEIGQFIKETWSLEEEKDLIEICSRLSQLKTNYGYLAPHWVALKKVCHGNQAEMVQCLLYWGIFQLQVHSTLKRKDNQMSFEYCIEEIKEIEDGKDTVKGYSIQTRLPQHFEDRIKNALEEAKTAKASIILANFNNYQAKYEKDLLTQRWHQKFYYHTGWQIALSCEDKSVVEACCARVVEKLATVTKIEFLEKIDSEMVLLRGEITEEFIGTEEFKFEDIQVIDGNTKEEKERNQYAANIRSWQTLWDKMRFLDAGESYLQGFLTKELKIRYDSIEKWEKMGWIKRETKEEKKTKGHLGKGVWYKLVFLLEGRTEEDEPIEQTEWKAQAADEERGILENAITYEEIGATNFSFSRTLCDEGMGRLEF